MTPAEREALAGEYALGTLDAEGVRRVEALMRDDRALRLAVEAWERRLAPLAELAPPVAPPWGLYARIERTLEGPRAPFTVPWPAFGLFGGAVAAGIMAFLLMQPVQAPLMTVLLSAPDQPAWLVEARDERISLAALNPREIPADRVAQLWALPQGASAPTSLGLIPAAGRVTVTPQQIRPAAGMLIEITLEPPGGSPTGRPTGPVLFIGRLQPARGS